jgi:hypothetical protein
MKDQHNDKGYTGKYFTLMLNMADDDLDPYEYRLLGHYIRVCGASRTGRCYQSIRTIAQITRMSVPKVIKTRDALCDKGWITIAVRANKTHKITVVDRMAENVARYSAKDIERESRDQNIDHHAKDIDHGDQYPAHKEQPNKNNPTKTTPLAASGSEVVDDTNKPAPKRTRKKTPRDHLFDELCVIWQYDPDAMTKTKRGNVARVAGELLAAGATPADLKPFYGWCKSKQWSDFTINVMASRWDDYKTERTPSAPPTAAPPPFEPDINCPACAGIGRTAGVNGRIVECPTCKAKAVVS